MYGHIDAIFIYSHIGAVISYRVLSILHSHSVIPVRPLLVLYLTTTAKAETRLVKQWFLLAHSFMTTALFLTYPTVNKIPPSYFYTVTDTNKTSRVL